MLLLAWASFIALCTAASIPQQVVEAEDILHTLQFDTRTAHQVSSLAHLLQEPGDSTNGSFVTFGFNGPKNSYDPDTEQFTGYLNVKSGKKLFFWMQLSKTSPEKDPVILYLQGGPGVSSMYALMVSWGSKIIPWGADQVVPNLANLNERATVIYLDNPLGVGFSTLMPEQQQPTNTQQSTLDIIEFLTLFRMTQFGNHEFSDQGLHIYGSSFGGHFVSALGLAIAKSGADPAKSLGLETLIMGNPSLDELRQRQPVYDMVCDPNLLENRPWELLDAHQCKTWKEAMPDCATTITKCRDTKDPNHCDEAVIDASCDACAPFQYWKLKSRDPYDLTLDRIFPKPRKENLGWMTKYLEDHKKGISAEGKWQFAQPGVLKAFKRSGSVYRDASVDLGELLSLDNVHIRVLVFAGDLDLTCPFNGLKLITRNLDWPGQRDFIAAIDRDERNYESLVTKAGVTFGNYVTVAPLMYARIFNAGHIVPEKRGSEVREMIYTFIRA